MLRHHRGRPPVVLDVRVVAGSGGGPDKTILKSPRYLEADGYHNVCAFMHHPDDDGFEVIRRRAAAWGAPLVAVADRGPADVGVVSQLLGVCRREKVAIWHGHDYKSNVLGLVLRTLWPMRLITTVHGWVHHTSRTPLYYAADRLSLPRYERVVCVSPDLRDESVAAGVRSERCVLVENGVDTVDFSRRVDSRVSRRRLGLPDDGFVVGALGRLSPEKGFDNLIRAAARIVDSGRNLTLVIGGEGGERDRLDRLAAEVGRPGRIRFLGFVADPRELYEALDVFVLSSLREGLPNVLLEAMAMTVPVVATRIAGVPRLVEDGRNGLLVEPNSVDALANGITRLLDDEALRMRLAREGRRTVEERYSFAARMKKMAALYDELLHCNGRTS